MTNQRLLSPQHVCKRGAGASGPLPGELCRHPGAERSGRTYPVRQIQLFLTLGGRNAQTGDASRLLLGLAGLTLVFPPQGIL